MFSRTVVTLFASAALVTAHGLVSNFIANGKEYSGIQFAGFLRTLDSFVTTLLLPACKGYFAPFKPTTHPNSYRDIACSSAGYKGAPVVAPVTAGSPVKIRWGGDKGPDGKQWPHPEGTAVAYLAHCTNNDCTTFDPKDAKFFKIQEAGLDTSKRPIRGWNDHVPAGQGLWIQNKQQFEDSWFTVNIPKDIKSGPYLLRHELVSLHGAHSRKEGAQYYPACVQISIIGGGNVQPKGIPATQIYTVDDGIVDIWSPSPGGIKLYKIPGPPLYTSNKVGSPTSPSANAKLASTSAKTCKPKGAAKRSVSDEPQDLHDHALNGARAHCAHIAHAKQSF
ncbi:hypothetical protein FRC10_007789 [Ceratobasidium sp. 414]|nr:hypothetical protein FRC10_007789 [Ceratobasidium sp. 414]